MNLHNIWVHTPIRHNYNNISNSNNNTENDQNVTDNCSNSNNIDVSEHILDFNNDSTNYDVAKNTDVKQPRDRPSKHVQLIQNQNCHPGPSSSPNVFTPHKTNTSNCQINSVVVAMYGRGHGKHTYTKHNIEKHPSFSPNYIRQQLHSDTFSSISTQDYIKQHLHSDIRHLKLGHIPKNPQTGHRYSNEVSTNPHGNWNKDQSSQIPIPNRSRIAEPNNQLSFNKNKTACTTNESMNFVRSNSTQAMSKDFDTVIQSRRTLNRKMEHNISVLKPNSISTGEPIINERLSQHQNQITDAFDDTSSPRHAHYGIPTLTHALQQLSPNPQTYPYIPNHTLKNTYPSQTTYPREQAQRNVKTVYRNSLHIRTPKDSHDQRTPKSSQRQGYRGFIQETLDSLYPPILTNSSCRGSVSPRGQVGAHNHNGINTIWTDSWPPPGVEAGSGQSEIKSWNAQDFTSTSTPRPKLIGQKRQHESETPVGRSSLMPGGLGRVSEGTGDKINTTKGMRKTTGEIKDIHRNVSGNINYFLSEDRQAAASKLPRLSHLCPYSAPDRVRLEGQKNEHKHNIVPNKLFADGDVVDKSPLECGDERLRTQGEYPLGSYRKLREFDERKTDSTNFEKLGAPRLSPNYAVLKNGKTGVSNVHNLLNNVVQVPLKGTDPGDIATPYGVTKNISKAASSVIASVYCNPPGVRILSTGDVENTDCKKTDQTSHPGSNKSHALTLRCTSSHQNSFGKEKFRSEHKFEPSNCFYPNPVQDVEMRSKQQELNVQQSDVINDTHKINNTKNFCEFQSVIKGNAKQSTTNRNTSKDHHTNNISVPDCIRHQTKSDKEEQGEEKFIPGEIFQQNFEIELTNQKPEIYRRSQIVPQRQSLIPERCHNKMDKINCPSLRRLSYPIWLLRNDRLDHKQSQSGLAQKTAETADENHTYTIHRAAMEMSCGQNKRKPGKDIDEEEKFVSAEIFLQNIENEFPIKKADNSRRSNINQRQSLIPESYYRGKDQIHSAFSRRQSYPTWLYRKDCKGCKQPQPRLTQQTIRERLDHRRESMGYKHKQHIKAGVLSACKTTREHPMKFAKDTHNGNKRLSDICENKNNQVEFPLSGLKIGNEISNSEKFIKDTLKRNDGSSDMDVSKIPVRFRNNLEKQNGIVNVEKTLINQKWTKRVGHIAHKTYVGHIVEPIPKGPSTEQVKNSMPPMTSNLERGEGTVKMLRRHESIETLSSGYRSLDRCRKVSARPAQAVGSPSGTGNGFASTSKESVGIHCSERPVLDGVMHQESRLQSHGATSGSQAMDEAGINPLSEASLVPNGITTTTKSSQGPIHLDGSIKAHDNFYQELEKDFGQLPQFPSPQSSDPDRRGHRSYQGQGHAPYTSTLEHKHHESNNSSSEKYGDLHSNSKHYDPPTHDRQSNSNRILNDRRPQGRTSFSSQSNCSSLRSDSHYSSSYHHHSPAGRQNSFNSKSQPQPNNNNNNNTNNQIMSSPPQHRHGIQRENSPHTNSIQLKGNHRSLQQDPSNSLPISQHHRSEGGHSSSMHHNNNNGNNHNNNNNHNNENSKHPVSSSFSMLVSSSSSSSHGQNRHIHSNVRNIRSTHNPVDEFLPRSSHLLNTGADNAHFSSNSDSEHADKTLQSDGVGKWTGKIDSEDIQNVQRWPESNYSYSDNEKQLLEEMRRMKKEHQNVLRTYEGRINKLMAKMHELRNIAEMLENSSTKSSPFGVLPGKLALLNILGDGGDDENKKGLKGDGSSPQLGPHIPPPLPPRPARGSRVYPNKPIIHTNVTMKNLPWDRIILDGLSPPAVLWKDMVETDMDREELERLFSGVEDVAPGTNLYEDICQRRGTIQMQPIRFYEAEHSQRIHSELCNLKCNLHDVTKAFLTLNPGDLHVDSFAELLELLTAHREIEKIIHHCKRKGANQLDVPEFLVFELSKIDHFKERLEFLRFKNKLQINLFEIDQQLKELHIACDEISSSLPLKQVLETVLAVGNYMNGGTDKGQADGYKIEILTSLKYLQDKNKRGNLLELIMKIYCQKYECERDFGCPTHFRLPEPSNMRHAAQVSFEDIQRALKELKDELTFVMNKLENLSKRQTTITMSLRVTSENFFTSAVEVLAEEQKLLEDTRIHFSKTTAFFSHNEHPSSPKEFFQLWASFLHDCKYYWKLAHRNLARAKFTEDLAMKNQMSSSSLPGFNSLKSVMMKHVVSFQREDEMDESKAQQLQHISSWIESIGRYAMEIQPEGYPQVQENPSSDLNQHLEKQQDLNVESQSQTYHTPSSQPSHRHHQPPQHSPPYVNSAMYRPVKPNLRNQPDVVPPEHSSDAKDKPNYHDSQSRQPPAPSSPKPLSAVPPNVIKPQPISHVSPTISSPSPSSPAIHNPSNPGAFYPTQSQEESDDNFGFSPQQLNLRPDLTPEALVPDKSMEIQSPTSPTGNSHSKKNQNFFKAFLKKDQKKSPPHISQENGGASAPTSKVVVTPFNKLKNTFVHKLSGSSSSKKTDGKSESNGVAAVSPLGNQQNNVPISMQDLNLHSQANSISRGEEIKKNANTADYQNCQPQFVSDGMLRTDGNDEFMEREESVASTASTINRYQDQVSTKYGFRNQMTNDRRKSLEGLNDMPDVNHPTSQTPERVEPSRHHSRPHKHGHSRHRAPIALGSNMSISDAFAHSGDSSTAMREPDKEAGEVTQFRGPKVAAVPSSSDPKLVRAEAVPVYKAKLIPNYENQTKLDPRVDFGIRGQAEAVRVPHLAMTSETYKMEIQKQSEKYVSGGSFTGYGQSPHARPGVGGNLLGVPTTYTVMPPKSNHHNVSSFQASPFVLQQHTDRNTPPSHGNQHHSKSAENHHQVSENRDLNHNIENKDGPTSSSRHGAKQRNNKTPDNFHEGPERQQGVENTPKPDSMKSQGRRSTSAHNLLSGNLRRSDQVESPPEQMSKGHVSRRDASEVKVTPNSRRAQSQGRSKAPSDTVTSLIDKFEKKPYRESSPVGLLDANEKPPSMTSTPVTRRKTISAKTSPYDANGNFSASNSDAGSQRSRSNRQDGMATNNTAQNLNDHFASFGSPSQIGGPFNSALIPPETYGDMDNAGGFQENQPSRSKDSKNSEALLGNLPSHHSSQQASSLDRGRQKPFAAHNIQDSPMSRQENIPGPQHTDSPAGYSSASRTPSDRITPNQGRSSSSQRSVPSSVNSTNHRHGHPTPSSSFQSPYLPKPEPHYPSPSKNHNHVASSQQNLNSIVPRRSSPNLVHSKTHSHHQPRQDHHSHASLPHPQTDSPQQQHPYHHPQQPQPQQHHSHPQDATPLGYNSWPSSSSSPLSQQQHHRSRRDLDTVQNDSGSYTQQLRKAYQSSTSAFERPLKPTYNQSNVGQKSNTAIVKPTVMHL